MEIALVKIFGLEYCRVLGEERGRIRILRPGGTERIVNARQVLWRTHIERRSENDG